MVQIRCFEDTGNIICAPNCNLFVGKNNAGKSSLLKAILSLQASSFDALDIRPANPPLPSFTTIRLNQIRSVERPAIGLNEQFDWLRVVTIYRLTAPADIETPNRQLAQGNVLFAGSRPNHMLIPFLARRKAVRFKHDVSLSAQAPVSGTLEMLYGRIDLLATRGHPDHEKFCTAVEQIVGLEITTKSSEQGKEGGFYFDRETFVTLERMGDGVAEMVALIVELCTETNKIFVLEEPETNLHPSGLKALLALVRSASAHNQFFIATHSNVVVRELAGLDGAKVFRVFRDGDHHTSPSKVEEVEKMPSAHTELLRELGYEFADFDLFEGWLFLEEASAESIFRDILLPMFAPDLRGRLRTYSSGGATNLEPSVSEFKRLIVFVHLQPVYEHRLWIRADGDAEGTNAVSKIRTAFPKLTDEKLTSFSKADFELYYPDPFQSKVQDVLAEPNKQRRRKRKHDLLREVIEWSRENDAEARAAWAKSAQEPIALVKTIQSKLKRE